MNHDAIFTPMDLNNWARKPYFEHYSQQVKCTYNLTVLVNIERLLTTCKTQVIKLYPAMIYIITTAVNQIEELRMGYDKQNRLGIWNHCFPSYTVFHPEDKTFSTIWTPYHLDFPIFHQNYIEDIEHYGEIKSFIAKGQEPTNIFPISCIPWVNFSGFNLNLYDNEHYLAPIFTIGQYHQHDNQTMMPIAAHLHHAVCDGYHAGLLFNAIKKMSAEPELWMKN